MITIILDVVQIVMHIVLIICIIRYMRNKD